MCVCVCIFFSKTAESHYPAETYSFNRLSVQVPLHSSAFSCLMGFALNQTKPIKHGRETDDMRGYWKQCWLPSNGMCAISTHLSSRGTLWGCQQMCCPRVPGIPCRRNGHTLSKNGNLVLYIQFFRPWQQDRGGKSTPKALSEQRGRCTVDEGTGLKGWLT